MPSRKDIQWSELRVGALVLAALAVLIGIIFLMSGSIGGVFARKLTLHCYFNNAANLKDGALVTLQGVTIGNVRHVSVVPQRNPTPVEVTMQIGEKYISGLHTDSTATITQAGVLGDSYVDIDSSHAVGPPPANDAELKSSGSPSIQDVINSSQVSIQQITDLMRRVQTLMDSLNSTRGTIGQLINDPTLARNFARIAANLQTLTTAMTEGKGSLGKLMTDDTLYTKLDSAADHLNRISADLDAGQGSAGKFLHDDKLYDNLNATVANTNELVAQINSGKGALGKLAKDPVFAQKLDDTVTQLDSILKGLDQGKGTMGQLFQNRSLYDHFDQTGDEAQQLIRGMRENPKKYLVIRLKLF